MKKNEIKQLRILQYTCTKMNLEDIVEYYNSNEDLQESEYLYY